MEPPTTLPAWSHRIVTMGSGGVTRTSPARRVLESGEARGAGSMLWTCQLTARFNTPGIGGAALQLAALQLAGLQ